MSPQQPYEGNRLGSRVAANALWTAAGLVLIGTVRIASGITAESFFGLEGLAQVTTALSVAAIITIFGSGGLSAGITKLISQLRGQGEAQQARRFAGIAAQIALILSAIGAAAGAGYALLDDSLASGGTLIVVSTAALVLAFGSYLAGKAIAFGEELIKRYVFLESLGALAFVGCLWLVVTLELSQAVILPLVAAYLPVGWFAISRVTRTKVPRGGLPIRPLAKYGAIGSVGSLAGIGFTRATPLVAGYWGGTTEVALVGAALFVLEPLFLAPRAISLALLPGLSLATSSGARREAAGTLRISTGVIAAIAAPFCALLILERDRILQIVFSDQIIGGPTLAWFAAAFFVSVLGTPSVTALAAIRARDASIPMWSSLVGFATAGIIWLSTVPRYGTVAVAIGYAVGSVIQMAVPIVVATRRYDVRWRTTFIRIGGLIVLIAVLTATGPSIIIDGAALIGIALFLYPEMRGMFRMVRAAVRTGG